MKGKSSGDLASPVKSGSARQISINLNKATSMTKIKQAASAHSKVTALLNKHQKTQAKIHNERINQHARMREESSGIPKISSWSRKLAEKSELLAHSEYKTPSPAKPQSTLKQVRSIAQSTRNSHNGITVSLSRDNTLNSRTLCITPEVKEPILRQPQKKNAKNTGVVKTHSTARFDKNHKNPFRNGPSEREIVEMVFNQGNSFQKPSRNSDSSLIQTSKNLSFAHGIDLDCFVTRTKPAVKYTPKK